MGGCYGWAPQPPGWQEPVTGCCVRYGLKCFFCSSAQQTQKYNTALHPREGKTGLSDSFGLQIWILGGAAGYETLNSKKCNYEITGTSEIINWRVLRLLRSSTFLFLRALLGDCRRFQGVNHLSFLPEICMWSITHLHAHRTNSKIKTCVDMNRHRYLILELMYYFRMPPSRTRIPYI